MTGDTEEEETKGTGQEEGNLEKGELKIHPSPTGTKTEEGERWRGIRRREAKRKSNGQRRDGGTGRKREESHCKTATRVGKIGPCQRLSRRRATWLRQ